MRKGITGLVAIICLTMAGCADKSRVPRGILSKDKMESVMWDMVLADSYASYLSKDSAHLDIRHERLQLYDQVFRLHDVSREKFQKSYKYYMSHPELTQSLFDSLVNRGNKVRTEAYSHPSVRPVATPPPAPPPSATPAVPPGKFPLVPGRLPNGLPRPGASHPGVPGRLHTDTTKRQSASPKTPYPGTAKPQSTPPSGKSNPSAGKPNP